MERKIILNELGYFSIFHFLFLEQEEINGKVYGEKNMIEAKDSGCEEERERILSRNGQWSMWSMLRCIFSSRIVSHLI